MTGDHGDGASAERGGRAGWAGAPLDAIELRSIRAYGRHGANPGEKNVPQPFDIDVTLELDLSAARRSDRLADTVDYGALHAAIVRVVREQSFDLIERLGQAVLDVVLIDARVRRASVRVAKPGLLGGATPAVVLHERR